MNPKQVGITPIAMIAAILFHADTYEIIKTKVADSEEEIEVKTPTIQIQKEPDGVAVCLPLDRLLYFVNTPYNMQFNVVQPEGTTETKDALAVITFDKAPTHKALLGSNGKSIATESPMLSRIMDRALHK